MITDMVWNYNCLLAVVDGSSAAEKTGQLLGVAIFGLGAWHCFNISRRPTTNTKCALSLMSILLIFAVSNILSMMASALIPARGTYVVSVLIGLISLGLVVCAVVLGIIGLVEYANTPGQYTQGRAQAIWALVLSGICCLILLGGAVVGIIRSQSPRAITGQPAPTVVNTALNFRFRPPAPSWVSLDMSKVNKSAQFGFMRREPEVYFMAIVEALNNESQFDTGGLANLALTQMRAATRSTREVSREEHVVNGLSGLLVESEAETSHGEIHYVRWYCVTNGWSYQLVGWGKTSERQDVASEVRQALAGFDQLDPARHAPRSDAFDADFVSPRNLYKAAVSQSAWGKYPSLGKDFPAAEFGAVRAPTECLAVVPVWLGEQHLSEEALSYGLLATMGISYPDQNLNRGAELAEGGLRGVQYDFQREISGHEWVYRLRCLQGGGFACLVAAWTDQNNPDRELFFNDAFARLSFLPTLESAKPAFTNLTARERKARGQVMNGAGIYYFRMREYERAQSLFHEASCSVPTEPTYVLNVVQSLNHLDRAKEALEYLDARPEILSRSSELRGYQAYFQGQVGLTQQAITNYSKLFAEGCRDDSHFSEYIRLLVEEMRFDDALREVEQYLRVKDTLAVRLIEADIYRARRDYAQAVKLLQAQHEKAPFNMQVANSLTEVLIEAKRYGEALELCQQALRSSGESAYGLYLKGRAELGLKWYREAKASFEASLNLAPSNANTREFLNLASSILGEGSNTSIKQPIAAVPLPAILTNSATHSARSGYASDFGAYYTRRITAVQYQPGKECRTSDYLFLRVLDCSGVAAFSTIQFNFDPLREDIFVNELSVISESGALVSTGKVSDYYVLDERNEDATTHRKTLNIPIAGLQPGHEIRLVITRAEVGRVEEFPEYRYFFSHQIPAQESSVLICGDTRGLKFGASPGVEERVLPEGRLWTVQDPLVARPEPLQPPASLCFPVLWIADRNATWPSLATNYLASIHDRLERDASTQATGVALVAGLTNEQSRLEAIVRHVQTNYTYKAIEFGRRARIPNTPAEIIHNKYGDCKDHSVLLVQLLEAAGIPARLALAASGGTVQGEFPSLDQFNHMVVYLPGVRGGQFVDCTDKGCDPTRTVPYGLAGSQALVLDGMQSRLVTVPEYSTNGSDLEVTRKITFGSSTDATVEEELKLGGLYASLLRTYLLQISPSSRRTVLERQFAHGGRNSGEFTVAGLETPGADMKISTSYPMPEPFQPENGSFTGAIRTGMERSYLEADPANKRLSPFEIRVPLNFRAVVEIKPPPGFAVEFLPISQPKLDPRFGTYESRSRMENNTLKLEVSGHQQRGTFTAKDYAIYRETMSQALSMLERGILLKPSHP
jgi:tetratricopeptide (TPR) repeat protein